MMWILLANPFYFPDEKIIESRINIYQRPNTFTEINWTSGRNLAKYIKQTSLASAIQIVCVKKKDC